MATINDNLKRIKDAKASIKTAIEAKGVVVGDGLIDTYASKIDEIQTGGKAPVLEALSVTSNGSYTPSEGVDGYNKVDVNVPVPAEKKIQEKTIAEITSNGPQSIIPDSGFDGMSKLDFTVNVPTGGGGGSIDLGGTGWENEPYFPVDVSKFSTLNEDLDYTRQKFAEWDLKNISAANLYRDDKKLVYAPYILTSKVFDTSNMFYGCSNLSAIATLKMKSVSNTSNMFYGCSNLTYLGEMKLLRTDLDLSPCPKLTRQSIHNVLVGLDKIAPHTLTLGSANLAKLTATELSEWRTFTGWTIS